MAGARVTDVEVVEDVAGAAAALVARCAERGGHVCLSGGSTPRRTYERLAGMGLDWSRTTLWFGDERCVPPDDERSNHRMAREALGEPAAARLVRMRGELGPHAGAEDYERELRAAFGGAMPAFDVALMGLGPDGHTASLFPGDRALEERERACVGVERAGMDPRVPRITLTLPAFDAARAVVFLVEGEGKAEMLARLARASDPAVPASLVRPEGVTVLCDAAAAARLRDPA